jgi:hypothetical protein
MVRRYKVEGTNDFLIAAVCLAGLGMWAIKDGWYPSPKVLDRHPREIVVAAPVAGVLAGLDAIGGQSVGTNSVLAKIQPEAEPGSGVQDPDVVELRPSVEGTVLSVSRVRLDSVQPGDPIVVIAPNDGFYLFNKSLAFLSLIGAVICAIIHRAVK